MPETSVGQILTSPRLIICMLQRQRVSACRAEIGNLQHRHQGTDDDHPYKKTHTHARTNQLIHGGATYTCYWNACSYITCGTRRPPHPPPPSSRRSHQAEVVSPGRTSPSRNKPLLLRETQRRLAAISALVELQSPAAASPLAACASVRAGPRHIISPCCAAPEEPATGKGPFPPSPRSVCHPAGQHRSPVLSNFVPHAAPRPSLARPVGSGHLIFCRARHPEGGAGNQHRRSHFAGAGLSCLRGVRHTHTHTHNRARRSPLACCLLRSTRRRGDRTTSQRARQPFYPPSLTAKFPPPPTTLSHRISQQQLSFRHRKSLQ